MMAKIRCQVCGLVVQRSSRKKYCSDLCAKVAATIRQKRWSSERYLKKPLFRKDCVECGAPFLTNRALRVNCSNECRERHNQKMGKLRRPDNEERRQERRKWYKKNAEKIKSRYRKRKAAVVALREMGIEIGG